MPEHSAYLDRIDGRIGATVTAWRESTDDSPHHRLRPSQKLLAAVVREKSVVHFRNTASREEVAVARSCGGRGGAFLTLPTDVRNHMADHDFELALKYRMYDPIFPGTVDAYAQMATTRQEGGYSIMRHDASRDTLGRMLDLWGTSSVLYEQVHQLRS